MQSESPPEPPDPRSHVLWAWADSKMTVRMFSTAQPKAESAQGATERCVSPASPCRTFHARLRTNLENFASHGGGSALPPPPRPPPPLPAATPTHDVTPQPSPWHSSHSATPPRLHRDNAGANDALPPAPSPPGVGEERRRPERPLSSLAQRAVHGRRHRRQSTKSRVNTERASCSMAVVAVQHFGGRLALFLPLLPLLLLLLRGDARFRPRGELSVNWRSFWVTSILVTVV